MTEKKKQQISATQEKKPRYNWNMLKWWLVAQIIPACFVVFVSFYLLQHTSMPFELAIPISIAWGALGATIHYLSLKRGMKFRMIFTALFAVVTVAAAFGLVRIFGYDFSKLKECPVCGFVTLSESGETCPLCRVRFQQADADIEGYASLDEYLQAEQMMFFLPDSGSSKVDFFGPCNCPEHFPKSATWKPSVTEEEVLEVRAMTLPGKP